MDCRFDFGPMQTPAMHAVPMTHAQPQAAGWVLQQANFGLFFTKILAWLLTWITLGFGLPWAKCMVIDKWARNVRIEGRGIRFTGTGGALFGVWVKVCLLSIVTLTLYYWFAGYKAVAKYIDQNLQWA